MCCKKLGQQGRESRISYSIIKAKKKSARIQHGERTGVQAAACPGEPRPACIVPRTARLARHWQWIPLEGLLMNPQVDPQRTIPQSHSSKHNGLSVFSASLPRPDLVPAATSSPCSPEHPPWKRHLCLLQQKQQPAWAVPRVLQHQQSKDRTSASGTTVPWARASWPWVSLGLCIQSLEPWACVSIYTGCAFGQGWGWGWAQRPRVCCPGLYVTRAGFVAQL